MSKFEKFILLVNAAMTTLLLGGCSTMLAFTATSLSRLFLGQLGAALTLYYVVGVVNVLDVHVDVNGDPPRKFNILLCRGATGITIMVLVLISYGLLVWGSARGDDNVLRGFSLFALWSAYSIYTLLDVQTRINRMEGDE